MTLFRVWAPAATRVDVDLNGERTALMPEDLGWWSTAIDGAGPGTPYGFCLDGGDPLPDPRSPSQPDGVHGRSAVVDHGAFPWTDGQWRGIPLASSVIYELHVGTFTPDGTFDAVIDRLDHLVDLGVCAVELMPVAEFAGNRGWGYDAVDVFAPHHAYGGPDGLKRLVDACHGRGLGVVVDVVYNHAGPAVNHLERFGPYFTDRYTTPWGRAVNLDGPDSDSVRQFLVDNAVMWLRDYHCDGLRLDAVHAIVDTSALHLLEELAVAVQTLSAEVGRELFVVAESDLNDPRLVRAREAGGYGIDAQWSDDFHHALHVALTGEQRGHYSDFAGLHDVATTLQRAFVYDGRYSRRRRRRHGRAPAGIAGSRFVGYLQNHDQVGNRPEGGRIGHLVDGRRLTVGAALVLLSPFVPLLFQGEEWGATAPFQYFTDHDDELGRAVRDGRRRESAAFGWDPEAVPDPQDPATFERSKLGWDERTREPHSSLLEWYRSLIALRKSRADLSDGRLEAVRTEVDEATGTLMMRRGTVTVAVDLGSRAASFDVPGDATILLASDDGACVVWARDVKRPSRRADNRSDRGEHSQRNL